MKAEDRFRGISVQDMIDEGFSFWTASLEERERFAEHMQKMLRPKPSVFSEALKEWMP